MATGAVQDEGIDAIFKVYTHHRVEPPESRARLLPQGPITMDYNLSKAPPFSLLDEPFSTFNSDDTDVDENPLRGLLRFGALTRRDFCRVHPTAPRAQTMIAPASGAKNSRLWSTQSGLGTKRTTAATTCHRFLEFEKFFRIPLVARSEGRHIKWPEDLMALARTGAPLERLWHSRCPKRWLCLDAFHDQFDVVLVHLPDAWAPAFTANGFDAHDALKALGARYAIPTQVINDRAFAFRLKASLAWRLSIAPS